MKTLFSKLIFKDRNSLAFRRVSQIKVSNVCVVKRNLGDSIKDLKSFEENNLIENATSKTQYFKNLARDRKFNNYYDSIYTNNNRFVPGKKLNDFHGRISRAKSHEEREAILKEMLDANISFNVITCSILVRKCESQREIDMLFDFIESKRMPILYWNMVMYAFKKSKDRLRVMYRYGSVFTINEKYYFY